VPSNLFRVRVIDYSQSTAGRRTSIDVANGSATSHTIKQDRDTLSQDDYFSVTDQPQDANRVVIEHKAPTVSALAAYGASSEATRVWPFEGLVEILILDLSDPVWETRHGAAIGLREVFRLHGAGAGRLMGLSRSENDNKNVEYLEDITLRCVCVFLLDRFGDYVSDQVVAPIRESVAQLFGAALIHMQRLAVVHIFRLLKRLIMQNDFADCGPIWEICHGGMLGTKYLVAVREDVFLSDQEVLDGVVECVLHGLANHDDDVRAVAAATLVPVADQFVSLRPASVQNLIDTLWTSLEELRDDLSASTGSVMDLLAKLFSIPNVLEMITESATHDEEKSFGVLIPRLFPFLRHTIRTVRTAVLRALRTFLGIKQQKGTTWISARAMRLIFQNVLFEQVDDIRELALSVWTDLISSVTGKELQAMYQQSLHQTASLLFTPIGTSRNNVPMESNLIIRPSGQSWAPVSAKPEKQSTKKGKKKDIDDWTTSQNKPHNLDGPIIRGDVDLVGEDVMIRSRITAAKAFARLMAAWSENVI
jgi:TATA-binding protein-associated factor